MLFISKIWLALQQSFETNGPLGHFFEKNGYGECVYRISDLYRFRVEWG